MASAAGPSVTLLAVVAVNCSHQYASSRSASAMLQLAHNRHIRVALGSSLKYDVYLYMPAGGLLGCAGVDFCSSLNLLSHFLSVHALGDVMYPICLHALLG